MLYFAYFFHRKLNNITKKIEVDLGHFICQFGVLKPIKSYTTLFVV